MCGSVAVRDAASLVEALELRSCEPATRQQRPWSPQVRRSICILRRKQCNGIYQAIIHSQKSCLQSLKVRLRIPMEGASRSSCRCCFPDETTTGRWVVDEGVYQTIFHSQQSTLESVDVRVVAIADWLCRA